MVQNKRGGICLLLLLSLCICCPACGMKEGTSGKHSVAVITKSTESAFWKSVYAGAKAASTEYNLDFVFMGPEQEEDYKTQNAMIEQAVEDGAEAIVFSAVDYHANVEAIDAAADKGVKIISIDSDVNSEQVLSHIGTDNYAAGQMAGEAILSSPEEKLNVGIVNYDVNSANGQQREQGLRSVITEDERVTIVDVVNVVSTTEAARYGTKQLLQEHPEINVIATFNEWTSLGVGWAIRDTNLAEETMVVAFDSNVVSVGMLETGEVDALIVQNPYSMGYLGVEMASNLLNRKYVTDMTIDTATTLVTRDNMFDPDCQKILFSFTQ